MASTTRYLALFAGLLALTNAHAVMNVPEPYGFGSGLTNGPMTQAAFPCKKDEVQFTGGNKTTWSSGQSQPLGLLSGATHGGGSCFIAMTYETPGSAAFEDPANWKNVHTLPGDCPATTPGNLETATTTGGYPTGPQCTSPDSDETGCVHSFTVPMPDELKDGDATFGWVWLSRVTTETYMNCAPITISGAKNNGKYDSLPSLQGMSFTGLSGGGVPGASGGSSSDTSSSGGTDSSSSSSSSGTSGTTDSGSSAPAPAESAAPVASSPASSPDSGTPATGVDAGTGTSGTDSGSTGSGSSSVAPPAPAATAAASGGTGGACTSGAIQCNGSTWSMCSNGAWVDMGSVGGLTCSGDQLNKRVPYKTFQA